jgi:DNA-binding FadR family transcriptional regulator
MNMRILQSFCKACGRTVDWKTQPVQPISDLLARPQTRRQNEQALCIVPDGPAGIVVSGVLHWSGSVGGLHQLKRGKTSSPLRLHGTIARDIGIGIVSGRFKPGQILSGEIDSSARLAVSRTAYREALRILAAKGLVESRPKVGTKVSEQKNWHLLDPDVVGWTFANEPDWVMLKNLFELRDIVESHAAALAAVRRSEAQLKRMRQAMDAMTQHTLATDAGRDADKDFHSTLLEATDNVYIISLTPGVNAAVVTTTVFKQRLRPLRRDPIPDHARVLDAIAAKNPERACKRMSELIQLALEDTPAVNAPRPPKSKKS